MSTSKQWKEKLTIASMIAHQAKYSSSPYLKPMMGDGARAATVRITPKA
jgi:hypothetical protein